MRKRYYRSWLDGFGYLGDCARLIWAFFVKALTAVGVFILYLLVVAMFAILLMVAAPFAGFSGFIHHGEEELK